MREKWKTLVFLVSIIFLSSITIAVNFDIFTDNSGSTRAEVTCDYVISRQDGNESFLDVTTTKINDKEECGNIEINFTFNKQKAIDFGNSRLEAAIEDGRENDLSALVEALVYLNYEPPSIYSIRYGADEKINNLENVSREFIKKEGNLLITYEDGDVMRYTFLSNPKTNPYIKFGQNSIVLTLNTTFHNIDYATNVTIEPNNASHLNISTSAPYDSLVAYWSFDGDTDNTTTYDFTENNLDGTYKNTSIFNTTCLYDNCATFYKENQDYITIPHNNVLNMQGKNITMCAWYNRHPTTDTDTAAPGIFGKVRQVTSYNYGIVCDISESPARWKMEIDATQYGHPASPPLNCTETNSWHQVCFSVITNDTGSNITGFLDGNNYGEIQVSNNNITNSNNEFYIGKKGASTRFWNGSLDELMLFDTWLTGQQISDIYNNQSARFVSIGLKSTNRSSSISTDGDNWYNLSWDGFQRSFNSNISVALGYQNSTGWQLTPYQNITALNTNVSFNAIGGANKIELNYTFLAGSNQFYSPRLFGNVTIASWNVTAVAQGASNRVNASLLFDVLDKNSKGQGPKSSLLFSLFLESTRRLRDSSMGFDIFSFLFGVDAFKNEPAQAGLISNLLLRPFSRFGDFSIVEQLFNINNGFSRLVSLKLSIGQLFQMFLDIFRETAQVNQTIGSSGIIAGGQQFYAPLFLDIEYQDVWVFNASHFILISTYDSTNSSVDVDVISVKPLKNVTFGTISLTRLSEGKYKQEVQITQTDISSLDLKIHAEKQGVISEQVIHVVLIEQSKAKTFFESLKNRINSFFLSAYYFIKDNFITFLLVFLVFFCVPVVYYLRKMWKSR